MLHNRSPNRVAGHGLLVLILILFRMESLLRSRPLLHSSGIFLLFAKVTAFGGI
jgi:hypothetical protein